MPNLLKKRSNNLEGQFCDLFPPKLVNFKTRMFVFNNCFQVHGNILTLCVKKTIEQSGVRSVSKAILIFLYKHLDLQICCQKTHMISYL